VVQPYDGGNSADSTNSADAPQDTYVARHKSEPSDPPPEPALTMRGFLGDSERSGYRRLYFSRDLDYYAEFRTDDVVELSRISSDSSPFPGDEATKLVLRRDATVEYTQVRTARPLDVYDVDLRFRPETTGRNGFGAAPTWHSTVCTRDTFCYQYTCFTDVPSCGSA
jgi:hypothetical protein